MPSALSAVELLAPAGNMRSLYAAIANGADAVYLGVEEFNARRGAENFALDGLEEVCAYAHLRGVRVYLTANVLILPSELQPVLQLIDSAWAAGIDAVIVQDLGLLRALRRALPDVRVHASTQLNTHSSLMVDSLASLGVSRVTLARELTVPEIGAIARDAGVEVESFVHGALCVCYSGQCLMSSLIGRRSANRGLCAQPCRLPYELLGERGEQVRCAGPHLLSPKDLAGLALLPQLLSAGVSALKIEGRMKSPEYVALVTGVYRAAIDRAVADPEAFRDTDAEWSVLSESFSRGFSGAYLDGLRGNEMMSYQRPNNRGVFAGRIREIDGDGVSVALEIALESGDTVEFWTSSGRFAQQAGSMAIDGVQVAAAPPGSSPRLRVAGAVAVGDRVFRVRNAALESAAGRSFSDPVSCKRMPLDFEVRLAVGQPLGIAVRDTRGRTGQASGAIVEMARTKAITAAEALEHVGRLGGTPYEIAHWDLELTPGAGVGYSELHRVRRRALAAFETEVLDPWAGRTRQSPRMPAVGPSLPGAFPVRLVVFTSDVLTAEVCLAAGADEAFVPHWVVRRQASVPAGIGVMLPRIAHDVEEGVLPAAIPQGTAVIADNLGLLNAYVHAGFRTEAGWPLNVVNSQAAAQLAEMGAAFVWLSPELTGAQIANVAAESPVGVGVVAFGRQELMVTEHCVLMAEGECVRACESCTRRRERHVLRDRKGYEFPVLSDPSGRSHVFNSVRLDLSGAVSDMLAGGVAALALDLRLESRAECARQVERFAGLLASARTRHAKHARTSGIERGDSPSTSGHYYRGVL